jgi:hypothetical protein
VCVVVEIKVVVVGASSIIVSLDGITCVSLEAIAIVVAVVVAVVVNHYDSRAWIVIWKQCVR